MTRELAALLLTIAAGPGTAQGLQLPTGAIAIFETAAAPDQLTIAIAPFADGAVPTAVLEGSLTRSAWKIAATDQTTLALVLPMIVQLESDGYAKTFACADAGCGGFDFRFAIDVLPPPEMQVNLADFQYWTGSNDAAHAVLLVSRIADTAYIQIDRIGTGITPAATSAPAPVATLGTRSTPGSLIAMLESDGRAILPDLTFATGTSSLDPGTYPALDSLAAYLKDNPGLRVALVGHTDSAGSLEGNIALSKRRAGSVRDRLITAHDVPPRQLDAEGMGYLAPIANNLSPGGRDANRRVEVILLDRGD